VLSSKCGQRHVYDRRRRLNIGLNLLRNDAMCYQETASKILKDIKDMMRRPPCFLSIGYSICQIDTNFFKKMQANAERVGYTKLNSSSNNLYTHPFTFTRSTRKVDVNKYFILATLLYQNNTNDLRQELHMLAFVGLEAICSPFVVRLVASN